MKFIDSLKEKARGNRKTIVLPEGMDRRTYEAASKAVKDDFVDLIILASEEQKYEIAQDLDLKGVTFIDPKEDANLKEYTEQLFELRKAKGMTKRQAKALLISDFMYFACMMVLNGHADGVVSGACHSSANTLRPSLQIIKTKPGSKLVSAFFVICVDDKDSDEDEVFVLGDCGLNQNPNAAQLADIAASSAESYEYLVGETPRVAMLSHSTYGSAAHPDVTKVIEATEIAQKEYPQYLIDGELQTDAALVPEIAEFKAPNSKVAGNANVLIFPDLDAGNIGYKLLQRLGSAEAYGPLCQGIAKPINDLSRGCSVDDIVGVIAITAVQAQD